MTESLYTTQTPVTPDNSDGTPGITTAGTVRFAKAGLVSGVRFYATTTVSGTYTGTLYHVDTSDPNTGGGTQLAIKTLGVAPTGGTWNNIIFDTPVAVTPGNLYRVCLFSGAGRYVATLHFFDSGLANGNITADANGSNPIGLGNLNQGEFIVNAANSYPTNSNLAASYFVDVLFAANANNGVADFNLNLAASATGARSHTASSFLGLQLDLAATGLTPGTAPIVDPIVTPVADELLACFTEQLQQLPNPPAKIQLRVGAETGPLAGPNFDECCAGLAWIRVADVYPSWDSFPSPDNTWLPCGPLAYAVVLEMGVAFCMPWSDSEDSFENMDPPNADDWATAFATQMTHQTLMRRTAACCFRPTQRRAVGEWTPLPVEAGCTGGKMTVTVSVMAPCGDC